MRLLNKNKQAVYFANFSGKTEITDSFGNLTGQYEVSYTDVQLIRANVSGAKGEAWRETVTQEQYGVESTPVRTVVTDINCEMKEEAIVWLGFKEIPVYSTSRASRVKANDILIVNGKIAKAKKDSPSAADFVPVPHNYIVTKLGKTINSSSYALREVNRS